MKVCRLFLLLVASTVLRVIGESQFQHERWEDVGKNVDFSCQSQLIQKYQPSIKMSWSKDEEDIDHTSPRIRIDAGGNFHISELTGDDAGTYSCLTTYWETTITTSVVKLHVGGNGPEESGGLFGIPFPWLISAGLTLAVLVAWGGVTIATKLRKGSGDQSTEYTQVPTEPDEEMAIGGEDEEDYEDYDEGDVEV